MRHLAAALALLMGVSQEQPFKGWSAEGKGAAVEGGKATITGEKWTFLLAPGEPEHVEVAATFTILEPAKQHGFFGQGWSVWPDLTYSDGSYDAGLVVRSGKETGLRVQVSHKLQEIALVKYPEGGYLRVVPAEIRQGEAHRLSLSAAGPEVTVRLDGQEKIRFRDAIRPLGKGRLGVGAANGAKVAFEKPEVKPLVLAELPPPAPHHPRLAVRKWLGGRSWIFDGDEPILLLPSAESSYINNVKLRPGFKPLLSWNSHWDVQTQGAFKEADNALEEMKVDGADARWSFRHVKDRFVVRTSMKTRWDERRESYAYDVESELEVLEGDPFYFKYGYDFEHHTPLDPFRWQYLVVRRDGGHIAHRPVYPVDPGPMDGVAQTGGARVWYGRHNGDLLVAPAVEYDLPEAGKRKLGTAVCAAFYDTGVSFGEERAPAGTKVQVRYRYTGYPAAEAEELFKASKVHESPMLDPAHHYLFADEWPKITFGSFVPMSETWIYGRRPFMSGHNQRPSYSVARDTGVGNGCAMRLGPGAYAKASPPAPSPLPSGDWAVSALLKSDNALGPGARIEVGFLSKEGKENSSVVHYAGNGSFDWKTTGFVFEIPSGTHALSVAFGNGGTGDVLVSEATFRKLEVGADIPRGISMRPNGLAPAAAAPPAGALADYRMEEGKGRHVLDSAAGPFGMLELGNLDWVVDDGRPALRFAEGGPAGFPRAGGLDRGYFSHPSYADRRSVPVALAGHHGGGHEIKALTVVSWIKPAAQMPKEKADLAGVGARRFILGLRGEKAPYRLEARLNVNDVFTSDPAVAADRWTQAAMTAEPADGQWRVRLFVDGKRVQEGVSKKFPAPASIPPSVVLGTELFYFHDAYYRGLIGRTAVLGRAVGEEEFRALVR